MKIRVLSILIILLLVACSSNEEDNNSIASEEPTVFVIPTNTPAPTPTSIPEILEVMPEYNPNDIVVIAREYVFQVMNARTSNLIGEGSTPLSGRQFLIVDGILFNYADTAQEFYKTDFSVTFDERNFQPQTDKMRTLQAEDPKYNEVLFPRNETFPDEILVIEANRWEPIFLVYELSAPINELTLNFTPANISPPSTIGLWLIENTEGTLDIYKAYEDGLPTFEIDFNFVNREENVEELIDPDVIEVDNCNGSSEISRRTQITHSIPPEIEFGGTIDAVSTVTGIMVGHPAISHIITTGLKNLFAVDESTLLTIEDEIDLKAAPGTKPRYQIIWYRVSEQGIMQVQISGQNLYIPYSVSNELEVDIVSLPEGECDN